MEDVKHPRECIADYCLLHCEKKEARNSRRSVAECCLKSCPLWYYRTGKLKWEKPEKDMSKTQRERRIRKLQTARRKAESAENAYKLAETNAKARKRLADEAKMKVMQLENAFYNKEDPDGIWR